MKARTSGSGRTGCEAVQHSDQMHCARCGIQYDVNDQDPPECFGDYTNGPKPAPRNLAPYDPPKPDESAKEHGRRTLSRLLKEIRG